MATSPQYTATPKVGIGALSEANSNRDGTGTIVTIFTAASTGSRIDEVIIKAVGTTTAGTIRLYIHNGTTNFLLTEISVIAIVASGTVKSFEDGIKLEVVLPTGYSLQASTNNAEAFNVVALGGDF